MNYISKNLRFLRKKANLTQEQFAHMVDMNRGNIASYEKGSAEPSVEKLQRITQYFSTDLNSFIYNDIEEDTRKGISYTPLMGTFVKSSTDSNGNPTTVAQQGDAGEILQKYSEINQFKMNTYSNLQSSLSKIAGELNEVKDLMKKILKVNSQLLEENQAHVKR